MGIEDAVKEWEKSQGRELRITDFYCLMNTSNAFVFIPTHEVWPARSVDARIPPIPVADGKMKPSDWLARNRPVEQLTWAPGLPAVIEGRVMVDGGWVHVDGVCCFNLYRAPIVKPGDPANVDIWREHIHKLFPDISGHIEMWFAQRVQKPAIKINHGLFFGGAEGIGKDSIIEPVKHAVGRWNVAEVSPQAMLRRFNSHVRSVILRISEARDLGDVNRYQWHETTKVLLAAPPDVLRVDEKHLREYSVINCTGAIITSNHKTSGIYLPPGDRRHCVGWSDLAASDFNEAYWNRLWGFYENGGLDNVAAYLKQLDLSKFDPKAPPPKTSAYYDIIEANRAPEETELADVIDHMGEQDAFSLTDLKDTASGKLIGQWLNDQKNHRQVPHRLESCGYVPIRNPGAKDGRWKIGGRRETVYAKKDLPEEGRIAAARRLVA